jgi:hypothetical protein
MARAVRKAFAPGADSYDRARRKLVPALTISSHGPGTAAFGVATDMARHATKDYVRQFVVLPDSA